MNIFIGWSGIVSGEVAKALRDLLHAVNPEFSPFVSSEDIQKGRTWIDALKAALDNSWM